MHEHTDFCNRVVVEKEVSMSGLLEMEEVMMTVTVMVMHPACGPSP